LTSGTKDEHHPDPCQPIQTANLCLNRGGSSLQLTKPIAACGGNAREAVKALIVANEFLESEVCELMQAVSHAYARGRFQTYTG
jgi:hypothetical protein